MEIACSKCGSIYQMKAVRVIMRDSDSIGCEICGERLYAWNGAMIWIAEIIERKELHKAASFDNEGNKEK